jgi:hypothetical protein
MNAEKKDSERGRKFDRMDREVPTGQLTSMEMICVIGRDWRSEEGSREVGDRTKQDE